MLTVHIDLKTGKIIPANEAHRVAVVGFISWQRLEEQLRKAGEFKSHEAVASFQLDERGITYRVERA